MTALAELDFSKRAEIHGDGEFLDGLAYGLNVLSEELRESTVSRDYYDGIIRSMAEGLLVVDASDTITDVNPALSGLLGYPHAELVGQPWAALCRRSRAELTEASSKSDRGPTAADPERRAEAELLRADGSRVEVALSGSILRRPSNADSWMFVVQDITAQKELARNLASARDAALHSAQVTAAFLANMSHEIRTPLNGVIGMAWLLLDGAESPRIEPAIRSKIETIHSCATLLLDIVNDILDLSKLESGSAELHIEEFGLAPTIEDLLHVYAVRAEQKGLELVPALAPELPTRIRGDVGRLRQILGNLISNAIKFTERGEVEIGVRRLDADEGVSRPERLRFEVRDTGIGIADHLQASIFQPFSQAETTTARKYGGTGLGLTICRRLVELTGGSLGCISVLGRGATFWFELPYGPVEGGELQERAPFLAGRSILVIDDNTSQRRAVARSIEYWGGAPLLASNGAQAQAVVQAQDQPPRLAVVDWPASTPDGARLLGVLAEQARGRMEIVLATSVSSAPSVAELRSLGVIGALPKPIKHGRLRALLRSRVPDQPRLPQPSPSVETPPWLVSDAPLLVVEDNSINQAVIVGQLRRLGLITHVVTDGRRAVEAVAARRFSLVLMDLYMPGLDGYEATEKIRRLEYGEHVPIIAVTANATEQVRKRCLSVGMDAFLSKPLRVEQLSATLSRFLPVGSGVARPAWSEGAASPSRRDEPPPDPSGQQPSTGSQAAAVPMGPSPENEPATAAAASKPRASYFRPGARVLVVDDDAINRQVLKDLLQRLGLVVDEAPDGGEAVAIVTERRYHLVLMDLQMIDLDGLTATRRIREVESNRRTPIVALTGVDDPRERARCVAADLDDFATKPLRMIDLLALLALWIGPATNGDSLAVHGTDPIRGAWLDPLASRFALPELIAHVREFFVCASRDRMEQMTAMGPDGSMPIRHRDVFALVTWAVNMGAIRLAGLVSSLERCRPEQRALLLELLDHEITSLACS